MAITATDSPRKIRTIYTNAQNMLPAEPGVVSLFKYEVM
jgi:hypothetical protein